MLDANTLQWLEDRDALQFMFDQYTLPDGEVSFDVDYDDIVEFEARVAKKLVTGMCVECEEFNKKPTCPISIYQDPGLYECRVKHARLAVEREMIQEGKGPSRRMEKENGN